MSLVLWSGGLDSTLALYLENSYVERMNSPDSGLRTITINHYAVGQYKEQKAAREKLKKLLNKKGVHFDSIEVSIKSRALAHGGENLMQPPIWLSQALVYLRPGETLVLGWIRTDDVWRHMDNIKKVFDSILGIMGKRDCTLHIPLEPYYKHDVLQEMKKLKLASACWWCEQPTNAGKQCKKDCQPCRTHAQAVHHLETYGDTVGVDEAYSTRECDRPTEAQI